MGSDQTIKVCHLASGDLWAGAEVQVATMLEELSIHPHVAPSAIFLNEGRLADHARSLRIPVEVIPESRYRFREIVARAGDIVIDRSPDILHSHRYKENIIAGILKRRKLVNYLVQSIHGIAETFRGTAALRATAYNWLNRFVTVRYFDHLFPVSYDIEQRMSNICMRVPHTVIHNAICLPEMVPQEVRSRVRTELGIPKEDIVLGTAGRLVPVKGYDILIDAFAQLAKERPNVKLVIAGDGSEISLLGQQAERLGVADSVLLPGFRNDIHNLLAAFDVFVLSSRHEGIPTVLLEAMALGRPAVVTAVGGVPEVVEDDVSALIVEPESPSSLAKACSRVLDDSDLASRLAMAGFQRVGEEFSARVQSDRLIKAYRMLAGNK